MLRTPLLYFASVVAAGHVVPAPGAQFNPVMAQPCTRKSPVPMMRPPAMMTPAQYAPSAMVTSPVTIRTPLRGVTPPFEGMVRSPLTYPTDHAVLPGAGRPAAPTQSGLKLPAMIAGQFTCV